LFLVSEEDFATKVREHMIIHRTFTRKEEEGKAEEKGEAKAEDERSGYSDLSDLSD
jgi:hypothetical protein